MRRTLLVLVLIFNGVQYGQTWVTSPFIEYLLPSSTQDTETVGPIQIRSTNDGSIITTVQINQDHDTWLIKYDSSGILKWYLPVAYFATLHTEWIHSLNTTIDNGCVYAWRYIGSSINDSVVKRDSNGNVVWRKNYSNGMNNNQVVVSVAQSFYNTTIIQFHDSLVEVDSSGNFIRHRFPFNYSKKILPLPDSTLLIADSGFVRKEDFNGNQHWSVSSNCLESALCVNGLFVYISDNLTIKKINTQNGSIIWTDTISINTITPTSDEGFAGLEGDQILKFDSAGVLQWTKVIDFSRYALRGLTESSGHTYVTGGCWMQDMLHGYNKYCPFITRVDSIGNGVIDSTHNYFTGNANDNNTLSFADDAVYIAAALGTTGIARDRIVRCDTSLNCWLVAQSVFGENWSTAFIAGYNHKFSDVNGDGFIDALDIIQLANSLWNLGFPEIVNPHWLRQSGTIPQLRFEIRNSQITNNDSLFVDVILGSSSIAIDSIYGLSMQSWFSFSAMMPQANVAPTFHVPVSALGDSSTNLFTYFDYDSSGIFCGNTKMVLCRNDHQNVYVAGDTIARLTYDLSSLPNVNDTLRLTCFANAITVGGFPVSLLIVSDSVLMSATTSIDKQNKKTLIVFPNPVDDILRIDNNSDALDEILVYDCIGNEVLNKRNSGTKAFIDVKELPSGIYILKCISDQNVVTKKFVVRH